VAYTIAQQLGANAFKLDLPPQKDIFDVVNASQLKLYEPVGLEEAISITHAKVRFLNFSLLCLKRHSLINLLDSVKLPITWCAAKAIYPPMPFGCPGQNGSSSFHIH